MGEFLKRSGGGGGGGGGGGWLNGVAQTYEESFMGSWSAILIFVFEFCQ